MYPTESLTIPPPVIFSVPIPALATTRSLLIVHFAAALVVTAISLVKERKFRLHQLPGLPLLFTAVALRIFLSLG